ncbi:unnamed protein product [Danaus chrysippus]|uniref:(African queen) hypothetical protein n=1 Tax=Danaus chrysippus TaxID=151541 RepID=A0A8J2W5L5_9NEOP|nr:unnamed protein product [Danaus chrysippus]
MDRQDGRKVTFEEALNEAGFGLYSIVLLSLSGLIIISLVCIAYASTIIVPASACELETTTSQKGLLAAVPVIALLLGAVPWGYLTDIYGRKRMLIILLSSSAIFNGLASISVNWIMLLILQFLSTFLVGSFVLWLPTVSNQFVNILETGEGSDLTLCAIIRSSINTPPDTTTAPCALNVTSLLLVLSVSALQSIANGLISVIINRVGRRNVVICVTAFCGLAGILVNLVPNAIGSAVLYIVFLIGLVALGLYSAIAVALFPTYLRALAVAFTMTIGRIGTFVSVQVLNLLLNDNCELSFYIYGGIFASSAIVAAFLVDDRQLQPKKILE